MTGYQVWRLWLVSAVDSAFNDTEAAVPIDPFHILLVMDSGVIRSWPEEFTLRPADLVPVLSLQNNVWKIGE